MNESDTKWLQREILLGFWKVHILHHASHQPVFGQWMLKELRRHGYDVSPGTLYPILKRMEEQGLIKGSHGRQPGSHARQEFRITGKGRKTLTLLRSQVAELYDEVIPAEAAGSRQGSAVYDQKGTSTRPESRAK